MNPGFFGLAGTTPGRVPLSLVPKCGACGLYKSCQSPKMKVSGKGRRKILLVGEAPGNTEDRDGRQFVGKTGQRLERELRKCGISMREDCWLTNALICRPPKVVPASAIDHCRPNLLNTIKDLKPQTIVLLGGAAVASLIPYLWKDDDLGGVSRWAGWTIPSQKVNAWVCPTFHPSFIERVDSPVTDLLFLHHLQKATAFSSRPWKEVPDYPSQIEVILDPDRAARIIINMVNNCRSAAFDYETDRLKPDHAQARILTCSVSFDGQRTISYPWHGNAILATKGFLISKVKKIGANIKFEERWTRAVLGVRVRNWDWDVMNAAHVLDNRQQITSVKFQAFVRLGCPDYDSHLNPYKGGDEDGGNAPNRLKDVGLEKLLLYCGLDSLLEYLIAVDQKKEMGCA
jgi:DNA polymerase